MFRKAAVSLILAVASFVAFAGPVPVISPFIHPVAAEMFGQYREGEFPVPQQEIGPDRYIGFVYGQPFKPFYRVELAVPVQNLPFQVHCCGLSLPQLQAGAVDVVHVYIDARANPGGVLIGPVESLIRTGDGVLLISAPYIGRRAVKVN